MTKRIVLATIVVLALTGPAFAVDMSVVETMVKECRTTAICPCPRAKIRRVDMKVECGEIPPIDLDQNGNWTNKDQTDRYGKCQNEVNDANEKIDAYNSIFDTCQRPWEKNSNVKGKPVPVPGSQQTYTGDGKTLLEQAQDAYKEAHPEEQQGPPPQQARESEGQQLRTDDGIPLAECIRSPNNDILCCLAPNGTLGEVGVSEDHRNIKGVRVYVFSDCQGIESLARGGTLYRP